MLDAVFILRKPLVGSAIALAVVALYWDWRIALVVASVGTALRLVRAIPPAAKTAMVATLVLGIFAGPELWERRTGYVQLAAWLSESAETPHHRHPGIVSYAALLDVIDRECSTDDTIQVFGDQAQLYWLADRRPASRFFWLNAAFIRRGNIPRSPEVAQFQAEGLNTFLTEFRDNVPRLVIVSTNPYEANKAAGQIFGHAEIQAVIREHYERLEDLGTFELYRRKTHRAESTR